jgi:hypothetical protein
MPQAGSFDDLIPLPDGSELVTLRDAANLPRKETATPEQQAAIAALMLVAIARNRCRAGDRSSPAASTDEVTAQDREMTAAWSP